MLVCASNDILPLLAVHDLPLSGYNMTCTLAMHWHVHMAFTTSVAVHNLMKLKLNNLIANYPQ